MTQIKTILVLDDWNSLRKLLCSLLDRRGFFSIGSASVEDAESILSHVQVDLAILDFQLEYGTSEPLFELLYERRIPFVIHTGDVVAARDVAADLAMEIWEKGITGREIIHRVQGILR